MGADCRAAVYILTDCLLFVSPAAKIGARRILGLTAAFKLRVLAVQLNWMLLGGREVAEAAF